MPDTNQLQEAIAAIKAGDKAKGRKLISLFLQDNPTHENALLWLSATTNSQDEKRKIFQRVLQINPGNEKAKQALAKLDDESPDLETMTGKPSKIRKLPVKPPPKPMSMMRALGLIGLVMFGLLILICAGSLLGSVNGNRPERRTTRLPTPVSTPRIFKFDGRGDNTITLTKGAYGRVDLSVSHRGESNFIVEVLDANGDLEDLVINEIGDYDGNRSISLDEGEYIIQITADGNWVLTATIP